MSGELRRAPRPVGLGNDVGRLLAALAIGLVLLFALTRGLEWAARVWLAERGLGL